ncbi:tail fiber assembly protein [Pseudomonas yamanorum]
MPYAANGQIAADKFDGAIKITAEQYAEALEGMCNGLIVTIDGGFKVAPPVEPEPPTPPEPTPEDVAQQAAFKRDQLLSVAAVRIAPLQDAIDIGEDTPEDAANLKLWKQYRVALNRIDQQAGFPTTITWPVTPN